MLSDTDSDDELEVDLESSFHSLTETASIYTPDSGISFDLRSSLVNSPVNFQNTNNSSPGLQDCFLNYEAQLEVVTRSAQFLILDDSGSALNSSIYLFHLCKSGCSSLLIQACPDFISHLSATLHIHKQNFHLAHFVSGIVHYLSQDDFGVDYLINSLGMEILVTLLSNPLESVLYYIVTAIHNILLARKAAKYIVQHSSITIQLVRLLNVICNPVYDTPATIRTACDNSCMPKFFAVLCDCLQMLSLGLESSKRIFLDECGISSLIKLITSSTYEKLLWTATRLLRVLSAWLPTKVEIISSDPSLDFFKHCLDNGSTRITTNIFWILRNLSDVAGKTLEFVVISNVLETLLGYLRKMLKELGLQGSISLLETKEDFVTCRCILGIIANLTCGNSAAKQYCVRLGALDTVTRSIILVLRGEKSNQLTEEAWSNLSTDSVLSNTLSHLTLESDQTPPYLYKSSNSLSSHNNQLHCKETSSQLLMCTYSVPIDIPRSSEHCALSELQSPYICNNASDNNCNSVISSSSMSAILDLFEAGFRCLSHLTTGHNEVNTSMLFFSHHRFATTMLFDVVNMHILPLLSTPQTMNSADCPSLRCKPIRSSNSDHFQQVLQLARAWIMLVTNLSNVLSLAPVNSIQSKSRPWLSNKTSTGVFSRQTVSQLRRSVRCLIRQLNSWRNQLSPSDTPKELDTSMELLTHLMDRLIDQQGKKKSTTDDGIDDPGESTAPLTLFT